jgi:hypothetical protein
MKGFQKGVPSVNKNKMMAPKYKNRSGNMMVKLMKHLNMNQLMLAGALDVSQQYVSQMVSNGRPAPKCVIPIEELSGGIKGKFNRYIMRPDLHPGVNA